MMMMTCIESRLGSYVLALLAGTSRYSAALHGLGDLGVARAFPG